ncbi:MAG: WbuC family cupin fold metalloprotein [Clostridiales bacterium]|nr:WbuC family cupin fold metalloprotein [Clostridiales bacterium]
MTRRCEKIEQGGQVFAIVIRRSFAKPGVHFFTPGEFSQQLGMLVHAKGKVVDRHRHKPVRREILRTQEVLIILSGKIKIQIYDDEGSLLRTLILKEGDSILLATGGHRVEVLEKAKILEVKQGPYAGFEDKEYF